MSSELNLKLSAKRRGFFFEISVSDNEVSGWYVSWTSKETPEKIIRISFSKGNQSWADAAIQDLWDDKGVMLQPEDVFYALTGKVL